MILRSLVIRFQFSGCLCRRLAASNSDGSCARLLTTAAYSHPVSSSQLPSLRFGYQLPPSVQPAAITIPPTVQRDVPFILPTFSGIAISGAKLDPLPRGQELIPFDLPCRNPTSNVPMYAERMLQVRRKRMKRHKVLKRWKRDATKNRKRKMMKRERAEAAFRQRVNAIMAEAETFNAEAYVQEILQKVNWKPSEEYTPSGRRITPHWTELMTFEKLYDVPESDYIDKRACLAEGEDWENIQKLRKEYYEKLNAWNEKKLGAIKKDV